MPSVKCPECGERVKYRSDDVKLRCPECGERFRAPDRGEEEERPRKKKRSAKGASSRVLIIGAVAGGLVAVALIAVVVAVLVRDGGKGKSGSAEVSVESYKKLRSGMTVEEVESILGRGTKSSEQDMLRAFAPTRGPDKGIVRWDVGAHPPNLPMEWRRWDGGGVRIWVAFLNTRYGPLSAYGVCSGPGNGRSSFSNGATGLEKRLEDAHSARVQIAEVRKDAKWVRGAQGHALVPGEWRAADGYGLLLGPGGTMRSYDGAPHPADPSRRPIYRLVGDGQLEVTHRRYGDARVSLYDFFVSQDELVLVDVTPHSLYDSVARFYYRMPPKPGGPADAKVIQPLIADMKSADAKRRDDAYQVFVRLGRHGVPALRELERTSPEPLKGHVRRAIQGAEAQAAEEGKN